MSRRNNTGPSKGQFSKGLTYQETHVPKFLQQMRQQVNGGASGHRRTADDDDDESPNVVTRRSASPPSKGGREAIPERPREGKWADGSDNEDDGKGTKKKPGTAGGEDEEDDEWTQRYGGGDDAPQIVVLNEGKHLSAEEVRRAKGGDPKGSAEDKTAKSFDDIVAQNKGLHSTVTAKRKQASTDAATKPVEPPKSAKQIKKDKKKEKEKKSLLSFGDE